MRNTIVCTMCMLLLLGCKHPEKVIEVVENKALKVRIYYPEFSSIDLRCEKMPKQTEEDVIFCAEAAFTEARLEEFSHSNIDGNHVSGGVFYEGAPCVETPQKVGNTGGFVFYDGQWEFFPDTASAEAGLRQAAEHGGMGFRQEIIIYDSKYQKNARTENPKFNKIEFFRVLGQIDGRLCIIENTEMMYFSDFLGHMQSIPVEMALYMDMGAGWNHSWYRDNDGRTYEIHPEAYKSRFCTNWLTFYK